MKETFEKSLVASEDISAGTVLTRDLVAFKKPGTGISAARLDEFLGRRVRRDVFVDTLFGENDFE
jgi:N-acetylneuraminate synthase